MMNGWDSLRGAMKPVPAEGRTTPDRIARYAVPAFFSLLALSLLLLTTGCASTEAPVRIEKQYSFTNAPGIIYLWSFGSKNDLDPPSEFKRWILGRDIEAENRRVIKPYSIAVTKGKVYLNEGRAFSGYWVYDLAKKELDLVRHKLLSGSLGIAVDDRDYKYLTVPRLLEAKGRGTLGTKKEEGRIVVFDDRNDMVQAADFPGRPIEVAVFGKKLFVTDGVNNRVVVLDKLTLEIVEEFGKTGVGESEFQFPKGITVGDDGLIYVGDKFNGRIKVFNQGGDFVSQYGHRSRLLGSFVNLTGIAVDKSGKVYAVDSGYFMKLVQDEVQIFDSSRFYARGEKVPPLETKLENRKNALYGYFQKPNAIGNHNDPQALKTTLYMPMDIAIDYENVDYFKDLAPPGVSFEYLIWMSSQFAANGKNLSVFAYASEK